MVRIVCMFCILVGSTLFTVCSNPPDYSTEIGKKMFPRTGIRNGKFTVTEIDPAVLKITGGKDVHVFEYTVMLTPNVLSKGYLFESVQPEIPDRTRILFGHWLGGTQNIDSSEREFFPEAVRYAEQGHMCVIPSGTFPWMTAPTGTEEDVQLTIQQVAEYRAALDLLLSRHGSTNQRVLFIGHDYGAMFGILTAAADTRIGAMVVMAPVSRFWVWNRIIQPIRGKEEMDQYQRSLAPYDPVSLIGALDIPILFQYARRDQYVDEKDALELIDAAKRSEQTVHWYGGSHSLNRHEPATLDRNEWIQSLLEEWESNTIR